MLTAEQLAALHELKAVVCPELADSYIVDAAELPMSVNSQGCLGWAIGSCASFALADVLADKWVGPRPTIVLDVEQIAGQAACPQAVDGCLKNVCLHEWGHLLPAKPRLAAVFDQRPSVEGQQLELQRMADGLKLPSPAPGSPDDCHGPEFCRLCIHAYVRARLAGFDVPLRGLFGPWWLCESYYLELLLPEAVYLRDSKFSQIVATPAPAEFSKAWQTDLEHHRQLQRKEPPCQVC
jgi:hypothetical protein